MSKLMPLFLVTVLIICYMSTAHTIAFASPIEDNCQQHTDGLPCQYPTTQPARDPRVRTPPSQSPIKPPALPTKTPEVSGITQETLVTDQVYWLAGVPCEMYTDGHRITRLDCRN